MKICVIIPVYNSENHIADVINSVLQYTDNLIVVNDGSTDGTLDVIRHCGLDPQSPVSACRSGSDENQKNQNPLYFRGIAGQARNDGKEQGIAGQARNDGKEEGIAGQARNDGKEEGIAGQARNDRRITVVSYEKNRGKGYALRQGFKKALELGFTHAITMDADGQHLATDIVTLTQAAEKQPNALIIGSRKFDNPNMPQGNVFANNFSNFWFAVQTGRKLPDTQTGFRVYPLLKMGKMRLFTKRYEAELELLVFSAWRGIKIIPQNIEVYYPPQNERLSHFRKGRDFFRISLLNSVLCFVAVLYGYPSMFLRKILKKVT